LSRIKWHKAVAVQHQSMKPLHQATHDGPRRALQADIDAVTAALFRRWPALVGFCIRAGADSKEQLQLAVSLFPEPEQEDRNLVLGEIAQALLELMDEAPETASLLRARTFARSLH
jgi:hypothetical protein